MRIFHLPLDLSDSLSRARQRMGFCALAFAVVFVASPGNAVSSNPGLMAFMVILPIYGALAWLQAWLISERERGWQAIERICYVLDLPLIGVGLALAPHYLSFLSPLMAVVALIRGIRYGPVLLGTHTAFAFFMVLALYGLVPEWKAMSHLVYANLFLLAVLPLQFYRVSAKIQANSKTLYAENLTDPLTKAFNRRALELAVTEQLTIQKPFALSFLDLDNFKAVNDTLGHATGDKLLRRITTKLSIRLRTEDRVFRLAGDEFVVLSVGQIRTDFAHALGERIQGAVHEAVQYTTPSVRVSASVGIILVSGANLNAQALLERADKLMYQAKKAGKNTVLVETP
ncbi:MAG TPA: GGDEF domain-containing protein [Limnobacter sp.]|nr:GGDEF domain-containing protein [Limnobacter sp.]